MASNRTEVHLDPSEARLAFLAIAYHLGRPGSELDPVTKRPLEHGLAEISRALQPQLKQGEATISLNQDQLGRLISGMLGSITELKAYPMLELRAAGGRKSTVPGFDATLRHLFPEVDEDIESVMGLAQRMLLLRRRLGSADGGRQATQPPDAGETTPKRRALWPFRR